MRSIDAHIANVSASESSIGRVVGALRDARERAGSHDSTMRDLRHRLAVLKEKIDEAREVAARVRVAVHSDTAADVAGGAESGAIVGESCAREFASPLAVGPSNTISLKYRPALETPDALLFLVVTPGTRTKTREYLAIEVKSRKVHVVWSVGAGRRDATIVKRPLTYIAASDRASW